MRPIKPPCLAFSTQTLPSFLNSSSTMELQFQKQQKQGFSATAKQNTFKERTRSASNKSNKFVGVRQRPSGKWVAEIKNTTQKIRMWLGTFDTAEEAARAYDEAACLLRGSNTRTNFVTHHLPANSQLSLKIKNLLYQKKGLKQNSPFTSNSNTIKEANIETCTTISPHSSTCLSNSKGSKQETQMFDDAYKPDLSNCIGGFEMGCSDFDHPAAFTSEFDRFLLSQEGFEEPKRVGLVSDQISEPQIPEFEHMKVERQISASLYAMNGVSEYWENVHDSGDAFWDLPMLSQMFCPS